MTLNQKIGNLEEMIEAVETEMNSGNLDSVDYEKAQNRRDAFERILAKHLSTRRKQTRAKAARKMAKAA